MEWDINRKWREKEKEWGRTGKGKKGKEKGRGRMEYVKKAAWRKEKIEIV